MSFEIKSYESIDVNVIKDQVDLVWEVTDQWQYPYATSYAAIEQTYGNEHFDPSTRFYAYEKDKLVGYITSSVVRDQEKGDHGNLRFPIVKDDNSEIIAALLEKAEHRFKELGISRIRGPAGVGMGQTIDIANKFGFAKKSTIFIRSKISVEDLKVSGNIEGVIEYNEDHEDGVKDLYLKQMGLTEKQGIGFHSWALNNRKRKSSKDPKMVSWKLREDSKGLTGFSYLHRSDHNSDVGQVAPIWFRSGLEPREIMDTLLSAHVANLNPAGMKYIGTFLNGPLQQMKGLYNSFGFTFDSTDIYEKEIYL